MPNESTEITSSDRIKIAASSITLAEEAQPSSPATSIATNAENLEDFKKRILQEKILYIGRSSANDIVLQDPTVSRQHAKLTYENGGYWIEDLGSTNKTYYNGNILKTKQQLKK